MIIASRHSIKQDLLAYGENDLAKQIDLLSDDDLNRIGELATKHIGQGGYISKHIALGAIEYIEGEKREPKRKKRDLSVYDNKEPEPKENVFSRMQSTKNRKVLAISLGVITYICIMSIFLIADGNELEDAIVQALISAVFSGVILWGILKLINKKKRTV